MSTDYWAIQGYGVDLNNITIDTEKFKSVYKEHIFNNEFDEGISLIGETLERISKNLIFIPSSLASEGDYLIFPPSYPWELNSEYERITKKDIEEEIFSVLKPAVKDKELLKEELLKNIDEISTYGCG